MLVTGNRWVDHKQEDSALVARQTLLINVINSFTKEICGYSGRDI